MPNEQRIVFVPNRSFHDFSGAERYGRLVYLTEGIVNRLNVNQIFRVCAERMADARSGDYILVSSLPLINAVASSIMAFRFGRVNYLLFDGGYYLERNLVLEGNIPTFVQSLDKTANGSQKND